MTREEVIRMLKYFNLAYKGFYEGSNVTEVANVWFDAFKDEDIRVMGIAAKNYVKSNDFAPTIAGLTRQINLIKDKDTNADLWEHIAKAARNSTYNSVEEFEKLPEACKSFVGSAGSLKELGLVDTGTMNTIVKGQFLKRVEAIKEHQTVQKGLPMEVRKAIEESKTLLYLEEA